MKVIVSILREREMSTPCFQNDAILSVARRFLAVAEIKSDPFDAMGVRLLFFVRAVMTRPASPLSRKVQSPRSIDGLGGDLLKWVVAYVIIRTYVRV